MTSKNVRKMLQKPNVFNLGNSVNKSTSKSMLVILCLSLISKVNSGLSNDEEKKHISSPEQRSSSYISTGSTYRLTPDSVAKAKYAEIQKHWFQNHSAEPKEEGEKPLEATTLPPPSSSSSSTPTPSSLRNVSSMTLSGLIEKPSESEAPESLPFSALLNASVSPLRGKRIFDDIYGETGTDEKSHKERLEQLGTWLSDQDTMFSDSSSKIEVKVKADPPPTKPLLNIKKTNIDHLSHHHHHHHPSTVGAPPKPSPETLVAPPSQKGDEHFSSNSDYDEDSDLPSGTTKTPPCAHHGRYYCSYNEDYPIKVVTEVTRYYKWPLEKLFRDLRHQVMPKLANDNYGGLVCDSVTRVVRPGWARNTNNRWLVVINTDHYQQFVSEVICRHGSGSYCNFIPPCYHATCRQRYNTQKLLVIDPWNPYKGPFLSEFLFPSCCICYVPDSSDNLHSATTGWSKSGASDKSSPKGAKVEL